jgi:phosphoribosylformylglycinamidine (FGAM) synthase-like amidotransferase family enzyme
VVADGDVPLKNIVLHYSDEQGNLAAGYPYNPNGSQVDIA